MKTYQDGNGQAVVILLIAFVVLGFLWGPMSSASKNQKTSTGLFNFNAVSNSYIGNDTTSEESVSTESPETQIKTIESETKKTEREINERIEQSKRSPYYSKISMSYVSDINNPDPNQEYISLYANLDTNEKLNLTGWMLKSDRTGNWVKIGQASTLPYPNSKTGYEDAKVQSGDNIYLVKGFSPIGISFRTNKCTGFFEEDKNFYPSLQRSCPQPKNEKLPVFSSDLDRDDECRDLIDRVSVCTTPEKVMNLSRLPDTVTDSCKEYLRTKINYNTCVSTHKGDTDFPGRDWYVYMNVFGPLWRGKNETITLYDNNGLVVDSIKY